MYETVDHSKVVTLEDCPAYQSLPHRSTSVTNPLYTTCPLPDMSLSPTQSPPTETPPQSSLAEVAQSPPTSVQSPPTKALLYTNNKGLNNDINDKVMYANTP